MKAAILTIFVKSVSAEIIIIKHCGLVDWRVCLRNKISFSRRFIKSFLRQTSCFSVVPIGTLGSLDSQSSHLDQ